MKLTDKDTTLLATLYEMPHWQAFRKLMLQDRQLELCQTAPFLSSMDLVAETRGKIMELRHIDKEMSRIHGLTEKNNG